MKNQIFATNSTKVKSLSVNRWVTKSTDVSRPTVVDEPQANVEVSDSQQGFDESNDMNSNNVYYEETPQENSSKYSQSKSQNQSRAGNRQLTHGGCGCQPNPCDSGCGCCPNEPVSCDKCDRSARGNATEKLDALVSAARMTLQDVDDQYDPVAIGLNLLDDPLLVGADPIPGNTNQGVNGRQVQWYDDGSFVALNQLSFPGFFGFGDVLDVDVDIPLWSYYRPTGNAPGANLQLTRSGPSVGYSGYPAQQDTSVGPAFFKSKFIVVSRSLPTLNVSTQYSAIEIYNSVTGALVDRVILTDKVANPSIKDIIVLAGYQGATVISSDDNWLGYSFEQGTITTATQTPTNLTPTPVVSTTKSVFGFLRLNPATGKFLTPLGSAVTTTTPATSVLYQTILNDPEGDLGLTIRYMNPIKNTSTSYQLVLSESLFAQNPLIPGTESFLSTGLFDPDVTGPKIKIYQQSSTVSTLDPNPRFTVPEGITGSDISDDGLHLVIGIREVAPPLVSTCIPAPAVTNPPRPAVVCAPLSVNKFASTRVDNRVIPQTQSELRYYQLDQSPKRGGPNSALRFMSAVELSARVNFVEISHSEPQTNNGGCCCQSTDQRCYKVAVGTRAYSAIRLPGRCSGSLSETAAFSNPYIQVLMFTLDVQTSKFFLQDTKPVAVGSFGAGFSNDNNLFATNGRPSFTQHGVALWSITEQH